MSISYYYHTNNVTNIRYNDNINRSIIEKKTNIMWCHIQNSTLKPLSCQHTGWNDLSHTYIEDATTHTYRCVLYQSPSYVLYSASGSFFIPFFLTVLLYVRIFSVLHSRMKRLRSSRRSIPDGRGSAASSSKNNRDKKEADRHKRSVIGRPLFLSSCHTCILTAKLVIIPISLYAHLILYTFHYKFYYTINVTTIY